MIDEEIEKAVLYYTILNDEQFELTERDFSNKLNKEIIKAINKLKFKKEEVTLLAINNILKTGNSKTLEYICDLGQYTYKTNPQKAYEILKNNTKKREVFKLTREIQEKIKQEDDIDIYIEKIIADLQKIEFQTQQEEIFADLVSKTAEQIEKNINKKKDYSFYTGFFDLDALTDGLHDGELTIIGARPRRWKNYIFFTNSEQNSRKKQKSSICKLRNVRRANNTKNII